MQNAAAKLKVALEPGVAALISEYTVEGRKAINILADAYSLALEKADGRMEGLTIGREAVYEVAQVSRLYQSSRRRRATPPCRATSSASASRASSLRHRDRGRRFPAREKGKGTVRFNETAGSMAKDSVFNAASVMRQLTGKDIHDYDVHINVIGGGNIDGPSAGTAILACIVSAVTGRRIRQDVAVTGEISLAGRVRPVGGVFEKAYGARQAGIKTLVIPKENERDIPEDLLGLDIHAVETAEEAFQLIFEEE